jgi:hypothetical protein
MAKTGGGNGHGSVLRIVLSLVLCFWRFAPQEHFCSFSWQLAYPQSASPVNCLWLRPAQTAQTAEEHSEEERQNRTQSGGRKHANYNSRAFPTREQESTVPDCRMEKMEHSDAVIF